MKLVNTIWQFKQIIDAGQCPSTHIDFIVDNIKCISISKFAARFLSYQMDTTAEESLLDVYLEDGWVKQEYRILTFTSNVKSGDEQAFINWLQENATFLGISVAYWSPTYNVNANLGFGTFNDYNYHFAFELGFDGLSRVNFETPPVPQAVVDYMAGDETRTILALPSNVSKLGNGALSTYPKLKTVYLFKKDGIVELNEHSFDGLNELESIYVPSESLDEYQALTYSYVSKFKEIITGVIWTVDYVEETTLTTENFNNLIDAMASGYIANIQKIIFPEDYTSYEYGCFDRIFNGYFQALEKVEFESQMAFIFNAYDTNKVGNTLEVE